MKTFFLILFAFAGYFLPAQITITQSDMPNVNDTLRVSVTNSIGTSDPTLTGPSQIWDYSHLTYLTQEIDTFVSVSSTPSLYQLYFNNSLLFPNHKANLAQPVPAPVSTASLTLSNVFNYYKKNTGEYTQVGIGATINGLPASVKFDSLDVIYRFPMNYGNADSCISKYAIDIPTLLYYGQRKKRVNEVDGWGTLQTPFGTFQTLRVKTTLYAVDTIYVASLGSGYKFIRPTEIEYKWLGTGSSIPLLQVNAVDGIVPMVTSVTYRDSARMNISSGVPVIGNKLNEVSIYPSPASETFSINYHLEKTGDVLIEIYNLTGKRITTIVNESQAQGMHNYTIDIKSLKIKPSVYLIRVVTPDKASHVKRLIIND